ncbi:hypothetical protein NDU88_005491 [Pleurodeles waltl]|uniref:Secreted protein n=1 Tax=Pleurodeles waltl TaxID=8319 RepID=A0AAV7MC92_PLEWA|nr:hypothetical protein NDU88_005491 [Pleurodeles waltl]
MEDAETASCGAFFVYILFLVLFVGPDLTGVDLAWVPSIPRKETRSGMEGFVRSFLCLPSLPGVVRGTGFDWRRLGMGSQYTEKRTKQRNGR